MKTIFLFLSFSLGCAAQEISTDLPVLSPQTPTTNDLGKYGEVQVNESSGTISPTIPLFTYKAGGFELPLSLNYSGNGVKVNQDPTWAGVNWNINPGGVITRIVNDKADELTNTENRVYLSMEQLDALDGARKLKDYELCYFDPTTTWFLTLKKMEFINVDTEVDIFNYNFLGYSGSFYLDINNNVHLIKYDKELKILFQKDLNNNNKSQFIIVTPDGNQYFFGGVSASESSRTWVNNGAGSTTNIPFTQNSFYLHTIALNNGGTINFTYENYDTFCDFYKIGITESATTTAPYAQIPCNKSIKTLYGEIENAVRLKEISNSFTEQKVIFNSSFTGKCDRLLKLNYISLLNNASQIIKIKLNYLTIENEINSTQNDFSEENKFFLEKVEFYGKSNTFLYDYQLTYTTPELFPSKNSFAQDDLGYYNGKNSNTTLLPITNNNLLNENCFFGLADREADLTASLIGSLKSIQYPTKGKMEFEYELPYKGEQDIINKHYVTVYYRDENRNNTSLLSKVYYPNNLQPIVFNSNKTINIGLDVMAKGPFSHQNNVKIEIFKKVGTNWVVQETKQKYITNSENTTINHQEYYSIDLPAGSYYFKVSLVLVAAGLENSVVANTTLYLPQGTRPVFYPGLRIKKVITFDDNNNTNVTRYYYNKLNTLNEESFHFNPNYVSYTYTVADYNGSVTPLIRVINLSTDNVSNVFHTDNGNFIYEFVTTSFGGDNFENGGKQSTFYKYFNYPPDIYQTNPCYPIASDGSTPITIDLNTINVATNDSYLTSTLKEEMIFNSNKKKLLEKNYTYSLFETNHIASNIKIYAYYSGQSNSNLLGGYAFILYKTKAFNSRLLSTTTKEYFGPNLTDEVVSTTNYTYKPDKVSLPSEITTTNSSSETTSTKLFYPSDALELQNLTPVETSSLNTLQQQHNVGALVRTENYLNGLKLDVKQVSYAPFGLKIYPQKISSFKGNGENILEDRVDFYSYFYGLPTLVSRSSGTKIKYEYNNNLQVVLKIENPFSLELPTTQGTSAPNNSSPCYYQNLYPNSMVTSYEYDSATNNLIKITDPKCDIITYHYDDNNRLLYVKDADGNILSENAYNYKN